MSEENADILAVTGTDFTLTIDSGKISTASLEAGSSSTSLKVVNDGRGVEVTNVPKGDSFVSMAMIWVTGDTDATVDVEPTKNAKVSVPNPIIDLGENPGTVELFGKAGPL